MARYLWLIMNILSCICVNSAFEYKVSYVHDLIVNKNWTCYEVIGLFLKRSYVYNPKLHAIINFNPRALADAVELDEYYSKNAKLKGKLHCVPVAVKDMIDIAGMPTTGGVRALRNSVPQKDATVIEILRAEGAVFVHKTNQFELAMLFKSSEMGGECLNPYDLRRTSGGSSSGSAVAISAGLAIISLGSDTIGSILNPSAFNGIYGLRPPQNYVDMTGVFPLFKKHDTVGPMAKHLDDLVLTYTLMNSQNTFTYDEYLSPFNSSALRLGYSKILINNVTSPPLNRSYTLEPIIKQLIDESLYKFAKLNLTMVNIDLNVRDVIELMEEADMNLYNFLFECLIGCRKYSTDEYFANKTRFETDAPYKSFESFLKSPILSERWKEVLAVVDVQDPSLNCSLNCKSYDLFLSVFKLVFAQWFDEKQIDAMLIPGQLTLPNMIEIDQDDGTLYILCSLSGYACLNVPVDYTPASDEAPDGLPVGVILIGKPNNTLKLFQIARMFEQRYGIVKSPHTTPFFN